MPAFQFDSTGVQPQYGGGSPQLPLGKHPVVINGSQLKPTQKNDGGFMELMLEAIDGPAKGGQQVDRLNLHNQNPETVRIANQQLSAYCHVTGVFRFQSTEELHGKPFVVEIGQDKNNPNQHRVIGLYDMNGNPAGQAGAGAPQGGGFNAGQTQQPPQTQQPQGGQAWGQQPPQTPPTGAPSGTPQTQWGQQQPPAGNGGGAPWGQRA